MTFNELLTNFFEEKSKGHKEREIGKYWASEIYAMKMGYLTPSNFFTKKKNDFLGMTRMFSGCLFEEGYRMLLEASKISFTHEPKKVLQIADGVELTVKPDFIIDNGLVGEDFCGEIHECKLPFTPLGEKYDLQCEMEFRAFNLPVKLIKFSFPFHMEAIRFEPKEERWTEIKQILTEFDKKLRKRYERT